MKKYSLHGQYGAYYAVEKRHSKLYSHHICDFEAADQLQADMYAGKRAEMSARYELLLEIIYNYPLAA